MAGLRDQIWASVQTLLKQHGNEISTAAKIAVKVMAPFPGSETIVDCVCELFGYAKEKGDQWGQGEALAKLGADLQDVGQVIALLEGRMTEALSMLVQQQHQLARTYSGAALQQQLEAAFREALSQNPKLQSIQQDVSEVLSGLKAVAAQNEQILSALHYGSDAIEDIKKMVGSMYAYIRPAMQEGVPLPMYGAYLKLREDFIMAFAAGDRERAAARLAVIQTIAPNSPEVRVLQASLKIMDGDVGQASQELSQAFLRDADSKVLMGAVQAAAQGSRASQPHSRGRRGTPSTAEGQALRPGDVIGDKRWRLELLLGQGGMGQVWRAVNRFDQRGAVKLIRPELSRNHNFEQRFVREIQTLGGLSHPNLVRLLDWGQEQHSERWFMVTDFIDGHSLDTRLKRQGSLSEEEAVSIFMALADGLAICHEAGIVHRDIKPKNIMLRQDGTPILIDFGIARAEGSHESSMITLTQAFAAPEQFRGIATSLKSDIYSLAATLLYALKPGDEKWIPDQPTEADGLPPQMLPVLQQALVHHPERRLADARSFQRLLQQPPPPTASRSSNAAHARSTPAERPSANPSSGSRLAAPPLVDVGGIQMVELKDGDQEGDLRLPPLVDVGGIQMVELPGGTFWMGSPDTEADRHGDEHRHQVSLSSFQMAVIPVTQELYQSVMSNNPSHFKGPRRPVEMVSWFDAVRFCNELSKKRNLTPAYEIGPGERPSVNWNRKASGFRLPTEAEWEYACRAGKTTRYWSGDSEADLARVAWYDKNAGNQTHPVAEKESNPWGLYDMHGNVWEWCWDWFADYPQNLSNDPSGPSTGSDRVYRGGSWNGRASYARSAYRDNGRPAGAGAGLGFRFSRSI